MAIFSFRKVTPHLSFFGFLILTSVFGTPVLAQSAGPTTENRVSTEKFRIPVGTILPARLNHGFSSKSARPGQAVTARIMQEVPLPNQESIPEGAKLLGKIVSVERAGNGAMGKITFRFDTLESHHRVIPIVASLRALAGFMEVQSAQTPAFTPGFGTPYLWANTRQIGGDEVYGVGGPVTNQSSEWVGKGVYGGVLVHIRAQPESRCRGPLDSEDRLQALWVFSSDACGVYGIPGVKIAHAGRTEPVGEITLLADQQELLVRGASGMLLRVVR
ncbi:MAG TPA: hypothetical protein VK805_14355 [Candidatus Baltobacteraceae bacterium]|nr:hypothetical protein [Candidatus Baltobacteraceae bacterium]